MSRDATASSLSVCSGELITVSRLNETPSGSSPDVPAQAACSVTPTGVDQPFRYSVSHGLSSYSAPQAEVEAVYQGFVQSLRTTPTRPLLGVIPRWQAAMCVIPRWIMNILHQGCRLQFQRSPPPPFLGVLVTTLASEELMCALTGEVEVLLQRDAIELVQPRLVMGGRCSGYFLVEKKADKGGGLRPIMD